MFASALFISLLLATGAFSQVCFDCPTKTNPIFSGQHMASGTFTIRNIESTGTSLKFHVTAVASGNWYWKTIQLFVGTSTPTNNPGSYPFKYENIGTTNFDKVVTITGVPCGTTVNFAYHAESYERVNGRLTNENTAWAKGDTNFSSGWGSYASYTTCCNVANCGECTTNSDCTQPTETCRIGVCLNNACQIINDNNYLEQITCGVGACEETGERTCVNGAFSDNCTPGTPSLVDDTCNGVDDNCNGQVDEQFEPVSTSCGIGACASTGRLECSNGVVTDTCTAKTRNTTSDTTCNRIDENCNGIFDEGFVRELITCGVGACKVTVRETCVNGTRINSCVPLDIDPNTSDDTCNGIDDNCDGQIDEDFVGREITCGVGSCKVTVTSTCTGGILDETCTANPPTTSIDDNCNGEDENCNGVADEGYPVQNITCGIGACARNGTRFCRGGVVVTECTAGNPSETDADCNGLDDNCNGFVDEEYVPVPSPNECGVGACVARGQIVCEGGNLVDNCTPEDPTGADDNCNGVDEDCDGIADNHFQSESTTCSVGQCAGTGHTECVNGRVSDTCEIPAAPENADDNNCNGQDEDCDGVADNQFVGQNITCGVGVCQQTRQETCTNGVTDRSCEPGLPTLAIDNNCNGIDEDCNGVADDAYPVQTITCGIGACKRNGTISCVDGSVVTNCTAGIPEVDDDAVCDGIDSDCDGLIDEDFPFPGNHSCGEGACLNTGTWICTNGAEVDTCRPLEGDTFDDNCNGVDDNCNGLIDEDYVPTPTECGVGSCASTGQMVCLGGNLVNTCVPGNATSDNNCNGEDDNCDGIIDNEFVGNQTFCGVGFCANTGYQYCEDGVIKSDCDPNEARSTEDNDCNGVDDNCDGFIDEGYIPQVTSCGVGKCFANGVTSCVNGTVIDSCTPGQAEETDADCNGIDDNCDGHIDEEYVPTPTECGVGACIEKGQMVCEADGLRNTCIPKDPAGIDDNCNGIDEDCDGTADEHYVPTPTSCGLGACARDGELVCRDSRLVIECEAGIPVSGDSNCNGVDEDCDGIADNHFVGQATTCGTGVCSSTGFEECLGGVIVDNCQPNERNSEHDDSCNNLDDNCNGLIDEDFEEEKTNCGKGECFKKGNTRCVNGTVIDTCVAGTGEPDNNCNGIDEDCNGLIDDGYIPVLLECGVGACYHTEFSRCDDGEEILECIPEDPKSSTDETCDGVDDNCNGDVDENAFCDDEVACTLEYCGINGSCIREETLCLADCHECDVISQGLVTVFSTEVGNVHFTYNGNYIFRAEINPRWLLTEVHLVVTPALTEVLSYDILDFSDFTAHYENLNTNAFEVVVDSPTTCAEDNIIAFLARVSRRTTGESILAYAHGNYQPEGFNFPFFTNHTSCCNPVTCGACAVDSQCAGDDPCLVYTCRFGECVEIANNCIGGPAPEGNPTPPEAPGPDVEPIPPQPNSPPPPATTDGGTVGVSTTGSGTNTVDNTAESAIAGTSSTFVIGGIGASTVAFFAIFGAVIGLNNTKKEPEVPLTALIEETESGASAFINPTFIDAIGASDNIMNS